MLWCATNWLRVRRSANKVRPDESNLQIMNRCEALYYYYSIITKILYHFPFSICSKDIFVLVLLSCWTLNENSNQNSHLFRIVVFDYFCLIDYVSGNWESVYAVSHKNMNSEIGMELKKNKFGQKCSN